MKIKQFKFLQVLAKHLIKKTSSVEPSTNEINLTASTLVPMFNSLVPTLKTKGVLDQESRIEIEKLEKELKSFFKIIPIFNLPIGEFFIKITEADADKFIKELYQSGEVDEVIYLPCQS